MGILVSFFSSAYWDASIQRVLLPHLRSNAKSFRIENRDALLVVPQSPSTNTIICRCFLMLRIQVHCFGVLSDHTNHSATVREWQQTMTDKRLRGGNLHWLHGLLAPLRISRNRTARPFGSSLSKPTRKCWFEMFVFDSQRGMVSDSQHRKMRSKFRWFTEFCNSHYVSQFAAFFIVARA